MGLNVPYLLALVGVSLAAIVLVWGAQRLALRSLSRVLYQREDVAAYNQRLDSLPCRLVLRRGTRGILRLEGAMYAGDAAAVWQAAAALDALRLKPGEQLNYCRKALSFAVTCGDAARAREYLGRLRALLEKEQDPELREVLRDAELLVGVYVEKDTALLAPLRELEARQQGAQKGLTQYRLAKLYHFAGKPDTARACLQAAAENLTGSAWQGVAMAALGDMTILEEK